MLGRHPAAPSDRSGAHLDSAPPGSRLLSALDWLFGFADWERGVGWNPRATPNEVWKLGRTRALLDLAGAPERDLRVVTVAGTNGKGSTGAVLEAIVRAAGLHVGVYSQPHLHDYRERVRLDGAPIDPVRFVDGVERLRPVVDELRRHHPEAGEPTTFELTTVLALLAFQGAGVDLAVLEVGLGGRLDAVNAVDAPLTLVTPIGHDHTQLLGRTLGAIAREKAGVFRAGARALSATQRPAAARALRAAAHLHGADLRFVPPLDPMTPYGAASPAAGQSVRFHFQGSTHPAVLRLLGAHQRQNAALAIAAAEVLATQGLPIDATAVAGGLSAARWPGRLEWVAGDPPVLLDGAHNPPGAAALALALGDLSRGRTVNLVVGCARDKNAAGLLRPLVPLVARVWTVAADDPRAASPDHLAAIASRLGANAAPAPSVAAGIEAARLGLRASAPHAGLVVVAGSLRVVAEARQALGLAR